MNDGRNNGEVSVSRIDSGKHPVTREKEEIERIKTTEVLDMADKDFAKPAEGVPMAEVEYARGLTLNLGKFESARVDFRVRVPCRVDALEAGYAFVYAYTEEKLDMEVARIRGGTDVKG